MLFQPIIVLLLATGSPNHEDSKKMGCQHKMISESRAINIAKDSLRGIVNIRDDAEVTIIVNKDSVYQIEFPNKSPTNTKGTSFRARVFIDPCTGKVLNFYSDAS